MARRLPARTTPDDTKSARTRERILDSTAAVLSRKGFSGTRLTDVAAEAQLQSPAIYYYFKSREELIEEVMWAGIAHMRAHVQEVLDALPPETSPLDRILAAVEAHVRFSLSVSNYTTAAVRNGGQMPESIRTRHEKERSEYGRIWKRLFDDAVEEGQLRPGTDLYTTRMLIVGALNWAAEWWNPRAVSIETVIESARQLVLRGIAAEVPIDPPVAKKAPAKKSPAKKSPAKKTTATKNPIAAKKTAAASKTAKAAPARKAAARTRRTTSGSS